MENARYNDVGRLVLRLTVGGLLIFHGVHKVVHGTGHIGAQLAAKGLPGFVSYGVYVGELVAPALVVVGLATRPAAAVVAVNMLVAIWLAMAGQVTRLDPRTGGWAVELPALYLLGAVAIALFGAGPLSVSRGRGRLD